MLDKYPYRVYNIYGKEMMIVIEITAGVKGMACGMCESHINDAVRNAFKVKKVASSRSKNQTVILAEEDISDDEIKSVIEKAGYEFCGAEHKPYEKHGLFGRKK